MPTVYVHSENTYFKIHMKRTALFNRNYVLALQNINSLFVIGVDEPNLVIEDDLTRFVPTDQSSSFASSKRNLGIQLTKGKIFLFLDDDCLPAPDWLELHLYRHGQGEQIVGGAVAFDTKNYLQLADNVSAFHDLLPFIPESGRPYLSAANLSVRRKVVEKVGLMKTQLKRTEDLEWTIRFRAEEYRLFLNRARLFSINRHEIRSPKFGNTGQMMPPIL